MKHENLDKELACRTVEDKKQKEEKERGLLQANWLEDQKEQEQEQEVQQEARRRRRR